MSTPYFAAPDSYTRYGRSASYSDKDLLEGTRNRHILELIGRGRTVLDVGCGPGAMGEVLIKNGNTVYGLEPDSVAAAEARRRGYTEVFEAQIDRFQTDLHFDVVLFADVLEHLVRPDEALIQARRFSPDFVVASVPNIAFVLFRVELLRGRFNYSDSGTFDKTHLRFFTVDTFLELFRSSGYRVGEIRFKKLVAHFRASDRRGAKLAIPLARVMDRFPKWAAYQIVVKAHPVDSTGDRGDGSGTPT